MQCYTQARLMGHVRQKVELQGRPAVPTSGAPQPLGIRSTLLCVAVVFLIQLSEEDVDAIDGHPAVKRASKQIYKALEAITGWGSLPKNQFKLAVAFENAFSQLKGAYVSATQLEELQRRAIFHALHETGGDKLAAARQLGDRQDHPVPQA
jgi:hypothetical protein